MALLYGSNVSNTVGEKNMLHSEQHFKDTEKQRSVEAVLEIVDRNHDGSLTVAEFVACGRKFPQLVAPAFHLKQRLAEKVREAADGFPSPILWGGTGARVCAAVAPTQQHLHTVRRVACPGRRGSSQVVGPRFWDARAPALSARFNDLVGSHIAAGTCDW